MTDARAGGGGIKGGVGRFASRKRGRCVVGLRRSSVRYNRAAGRHSSTSELIDTGTQHSAAHDRDRESLVVAAVSIRVLDYGGRPVRERDRRADQAPLDAERHVRQTT